MTNLERWQFYMKDITSPDGFIKWGFYAMIAAALQRRVYLGTLRKPLFPNLYILLVAEPGVGKGRVITEIESALRYHKKPKNTDAALMNGDNEKYKRADYIKKLEAPLLIPVGPSSVTYEKLLDILGSGCRSEWYTEGTLTNVYMHSSLCVCLEEFSSLVRKKSEDLMNFFLPAYDCGDYRYDTISRGEAIIKNCCLNLIAGTTPGFIRNVFNSSLLTEGFSSRAIFVYEPKARFRKFSPPTFSPEQIEAHNKILEHLKKLGSLPFGQVKVSPEIIKKL
jgi:hypothetical protein